MVAGVQTRFYFCIVFIPSLVKNCNLSLYLQYQKNPKPKIKQKKPANNKKYKPKPHTNKKTTHTNQQTKNPTPNFKPHSLTNLQWKAGALPSPRH